MSCLGRTGFSFEGRGGRADVTHTIRMPDVTGKLHRRGHQRVVLGEFELRGEYASFEGSAFGPLDYGFPVEEIVFIGGAGGDAFGWVDGERFVLLEETFGGDGVHGGCCILQVIAGERGGRWKDELWCLVARLSAHRPRETPPASLGSHADNSLRTLALVIVPAQAMTFTQTTAWRQ